MPEGLTNVRGMAIYIFLYFCKTKINVMKKIVTILSSLLIILGLKAQKTDSVKKETLPQVKLVKTENTVISTTATSTTTIKEATIKDTKIKDATIKDAKIKDATIKDAKIKDTKIKEATIKETRALPDKI